MSRKIASSNEQNNSNNNNSVCVMYKRKIYDSTYRREPNVKQLRNPFVS